MTSDATTALVLPDISREVAIEEKKRLSGLIEGFGSLKPAQVKLGVQLMQAGFHESHFNILHGNLFMNMDGRSYWAARTYGSAWGGVTHRPMTADERVAYKLQDEEVGVVATAYKIVQGLRIEVATDIGRAGGRRDAKQTVVQAGNEAEMAIKRARARCLRAAAPLGVDMGTVDAEMVVDDAPPIEDEPEQLTPADPFGVEDEVEEPEAEIDDDEIIDAESVEVEEEPAPEPKAEKSIDLSEPAGKPRTTDEVLASAYETLVKLVKGDTGLRNVDAWKFEWQELKGQKAAKMALTEGWSPAQVIALIKAQRDARDG